MSRSFQPQIVLGYGAVDPKLGLSAGELERFQHRFLHQDLSTVIVCPTRGQIDAQVVDSWMALLKPPNQKVAHIWARGMEVGAAYDAIISAVLVNPEVQNWRYVLTIEEDNLPQPRALVDLLEAAEEHEMDVLGALYYVKGPAGFAQIWGDPEDPEENFRPLSPSYDSEAERIDQIQRCQGTGMGFTLYRMDLFRKIPPPWFRTDPTTDGPWTQDLFFFHRARALGLPVERVGVHCGVRVGHLDVQSGAVW